jgi:hypothetical protein
MCFEIFDMLKSFELLPKKIYPSVPRVIIDEFQHIPHLVDRRIGNRTHEVTMDKLQGRGGPPSLPFLKLLLRMFVKNTSLTNSFGKLYVEQAFDHS